MDGVTHAQAPQEVVSLDGILAAARATAVSLFIDPQTRKLTEKGLESMLTDALATLRYCRDAPAWGIDPLFDPGERTELVQGALQAVLSIQLAIALRVLAVVQPVAPPAKEPS